MKTQSQPFRFDSLNLLNFLIKKRSLIIITILATAVISAAITFLITPNFRSAAIILPTPNVLETRSLNNTQNTPTDLFGDEQATEMVLQIIQSDKITDYLIKKYDLLVHYKLEGKDKQYTLLDKRMKKNISARKTQFNSIEISVVDTDPAIAASIANDIVASVDSVFNSLRKEAAAKTVRVITELYNKQLFRLKSIEDSLSMPQKTNRPISGSILSVLGSREKSGQTVSVSVNGSSYSTEYVRLLNSFLLETENLSVIQASLLEARTFADQDLQYIYVIRQAKAAEIKATPNRSLIVVVSVFSATLLMLIILLLLDPMTRDEKQDLR